MEDGELAAAKKLWLHPDLLKWYGFTDGWSDIENWEKPYEILKHAESVLSSTNSSPYRSDVVVNLKRSVDSRVRHLDRVYRFKKIPLKGEKGGQYERMRALGIIRPLMVDKLYEIRNAIEHRDSEPPSQKDCSELLEFVWYFLRSTDQLARSQVSDFTLQKSNERGDNGYALNFKISPDDWLIRFYGWIPDGLFSLKALSAWIEVDAEEIKPYAVLAEKMKEAPEFALGYFPKVKERDILVHGSIPLGSCDELYRIYFRLY